MERIRTSNYPGFFGVKKKVMRNVEDRKRKLLYLMGLYERKIRRIPFLLNEGMNAQVDINVDFLSNGNIDIYVTGVEYEFVVSELAGPIHRALNIDWAKMNVDGWSKEITLISDRMRYPTKSYDYVYVIIHIQEKEMRSCELKEVTVKVVEQPQWRNQTEWRMVCHE